MTDSVRTRAQLVDDFGPEGGSDPTIKMRNLISSLYAYIDTSVIAPSLLGYVGAANDNIDCIELGNQVDHVTKLSLSSYSLPSMGDNASLGIGKLMYTFPAGVIVIGSVYIHLKLLIADAVKTATPKVGLGNVIASGAVSVLSGTATFENMLAGQSGTVDNVFFGQAASPPSPPLILQTGDARTMYLNLAAAWPDITVNGITVSGSINFSWRNLGT